jgi:hypothetical protein
MGRITPHPGILIKSAETIGKEKDKMLFLAKSA